MTDRIYDRRLECGCLVSSDGGGGVIPCCYPGYDLYNSKEEEMVLVEKCEKAWNGWRGTDDYKIYKWECIVKNNSEQSIKELIHENKDIEELFNEVEKVNYHHQNH